MLKMIWIAAISAAFSFGGFAPMATLVSDTFTDTNGVRIESHTPDTDFSGWGWGEVTNTWEIQSNRLRANTAITGWSYAMIQTEQADIDISVDMVLGAAAYAGGIVVRYKDTRNFWRISNQTNTDSIVIYEVTNNVLTLRASGAATMNPSNTYTMRVTTSGNTITAYWDGVQIAQYTSATAHNDKMIHGLMTYVGDGFTTTLFDNLTMTGDERATPAFTEWSHNDTAIGEHPIIEDGLMYVSQLNTTTATNGGINIYDYRDGTPLAEILLSNTGIASAPAISGKNIIVRATSGTVWVINRYGGIKQTATGFTVVDYESLTYDSSNDRVLVPVSNRLAARAVSNITTNVWSSAAVINGSTSMGAPLINGSYVYFLDSNAVLYKLNLSDGTTAGSIDLSTVTIDVTYASPVYDTVRNDVYVGDETGRTIFSVDVSTNTLATNWSVTLGSAGESIFRNFVYHDDVLYVTLRQTTTPFRSKIYALDVTNSGNVLWTNTTTFDNDAQVSAMLVDNQYLYATTYDYNVGTYEKLLVININTGALVTSFDLDTGASSGIPAAQNGYIYVPLWDNLGMQAIRVRTDGGTGDFMWKADSNMTGYIGAFMSGNLIGFGRQPRFGVTMLTAPVSVV